MKDLIKLALFGAIAILVFDAISATILRSSGIAYPWFSLGSFILQGVFGYIAGRKTKWYFGALIGAALGLIESTLGWMISWNIGPGKPDIEMNLALTVGTIIFVVLCAAVIGLVGGAISLLKKKNA